MVIGYDEDRPTEQDYKDFLAEFVNGLQGKVDELSLMIYGSFVRGDYQPGRSDIDALMVFPDDVVIDKYKLRIVSKKLHKALEGRNIPFQITVTDLTTMKDGRFNSFPPSFKPYFEDEGIILLGPDYTSQFRFELPTMDEQGPLTFNLRKSRQGLLFAEHLINTDYVAFIEKFKRSLDGISRGSKQIMDMADDKFRVNRFSALEGLVTTFPNINPGPLEKIKYLYKNLQELDELYKRSEEVTTLWNDSVTFFEEMIKAYVKKFPRS